MNLRCSKLEVLAILVSRGFLERVRDYGPDLLALRVAAHDSIYDG